jgi:integrase
MKGRVRKTPDFRVPLSTEALAVIEQAKPFERDGYVFPSVREGVISDATMSLLMERRQMTARPHGFRSSFRVWCEEAGDVPFEVAEAELSHVVGGSVERAYKRTDHLDKRRSVMDRWAQYVSGTTPQASA